MQTFHYEVKDTTTQQVHRQRLGSVHASAAGSQLSSAPSLSTTMSSWQDAVPCTQSATYPHGTFHQPFKRKHPSAARAGPLITILIQTHATFAKNFFYRSCSLCRATKQLCCKSPAKRATQTASQRHYPISLTADSHRQLTSALPAALATHSLKQNTHRICCLRAQRCKDENLASP